MAMANGIAPRHGLVTIDGGYTHKRMSNTYSGATQYREQTKVSENRYQGIKINDRAQQPLVTKADTRWDALLIWLRNVGPHYSMLTPAGTRKMTMTSGMVPRHRLATIDSGYMHTRMSNTYVGLTQHREHTKWDTRYQDQR